MPSGNLDSKIAQKIAELETYANNIPAAIIIHDLRDWTVEWMSENALSKLGVTLEEIKSLSSDQYFSRFFNQEDSKDYVPKILGLLEDNNDENMCTYFQQVRYAAKKDWSWHMASTKIFMRDDEGNPLLSITIALAIDSMHHMNVKAERLLQENNFLRKHFHYFDRLSKREREVLKYLALGKSTAEISLELFISEHTVETHKRNIKQKLKANSAYKLSEFARAFDLI